MVVETWDSLRMKVGELRLQKDTSESVKKMFKGRLQYLTMKKSIFCFLQNSHP